MRAQVFAVLLFLAISVSSSLQQLQISRGQPRVRSQPKQKLDEVEETIRLVTEGEAAIENDINRIPIRNFVLVLGNTGAGKSTITKFLTQHEKLESYDAGDRFLIRDINQTNQGRVSTIISQTLLPELFIDPKSGTAFFDMPGFSDTRNASVETANSWFMKKVADRAERVKLLFIVNYSSLRDGETRHAFKNMLDHATNYIKYSSTKFSKSVALIATKVDVAEKKEVIHSVIKSFFEQTLESLEEVFEDPVKIERAEDILNSLLRLSTKGLARVSYFTQPNSAAPLTSFPDLMTTRKGMWNIINRMSWAPVTEADFGVSLSSNALLLVQRSESFINSRVATEISAIAQKVGEFFQVQVDRDPLSSLGSLVVLQETFLNLTSSMKTASSRSQFLQGLHHITDALSIPNVTLYYEEIGKREQNMAVLQKISSSTFSFPVHDWSRILTYTQGTIRTSVNRAISVFNGHVEGQLVNISNTLQTRVFYRLNQSTSSNETVELLQDVFQVLDSSLPDLRASPTYNAFVHKLAVLANATSISIEQEEISPDVSLQNYRDGISPFQLFSWIRPLESLNTLLKEKATAAGWSLREQRHNQTLESLQQNRTQLEQQLEAELQAVQLQMSELEANATREIEESQRQIVKLQEQQRLNASLERDLITRQLEELQQAGERNFTYTLLEANRTLTAQQAFQTQKLEDLMKEIQRERERGEAIQRAAEAQKKQGQGQILQLKAQHDALRASKQVRPGTETQGSPTRRFHESSTVTSHWTPGAAEPGRDGGSPSQEEAAPKPRKTPTRRPQSYRKFSSRGQTRGAAREGEILMTTAKTPTVVPTLPPVSLPPDLEQPQLRSEQEENSPELAGAARLGQDEGRHLQQEASQPWKPIGSEHGRHFPSSVHFGHGRQGYKEGADGETRMATDSTPTADPTLYPPSVIEDEEEQ